MMNWFAENLGTIIITLVLAGVVALICAYLIGQRKEMRFAASPSRSIKQAEGGHRATWKNA